MRLLSVPALGLAILAASGCSPVTDPRRPAASRLAIAVPPAREPSPPTAPIRAWTGIHVADPLLAHVLRLALEEASAWLAEPECQRVLLEFTDARGRPLFEALTAVGASELTYLELLLFRDVPDTRYCSSGELARTAPGSRLIFVCGTSLIASWSANPRHVVAGIVHEALHSLGLAENPPSSAEITNQILSRCSAIVRPW